MTIPGITEDEIDEKYLELLDLVDEMKRYQNQGFRALSRVILSKKGVLRVCASKVHTGSF
jgi:hypothetical protein